MAEGRNQLPLRLLASHRRRLDGGRMVRCATETRAGSKLLVWASRIRIRGPRSLLANLPVRRVVLVALPDGACLVAGVQESETESSSAGIVPRRLGGDRHVLRRRSDVGTANPSRDGRILALVGRASVGGGIL